MESVWDGLLKGDMAYGFLRDGFGVLGEPPVWIHALSPEQYLLKYASGDDLLVFTVDPTAFDQLIITQASKTLGEVITVVGDFRQATPSERSAFDRSFTGPNSMWKTETNKVNNFLRESSNNANANINVNLGRGFASPPSASTSVPMNTSENRPTLGVMRPTPAQSTNTILPVGMLIPATIRHNEEGVKDGFILALSSNTYAILKDGAYEIHSIFHVKPGNTSHEHHYKDVVEFVSPSTQETTRLSGYISPRATKEEKTAFDDFIQRLLTAYSSAYASQQIAAPSNGYGIGYGAPAYGTSAFPDREDIRCGRKIKAWYHANDICTCNFTDLVAAMNQDLQNKIDPRIRLQRCIDARQVDIDERRPVGQNLKTHQATIEKLTILINALNDRYATGGNLYSFRIGYERAGAGDKFTITNVLKPDLKPRGGKRKSRKAKKSKRRHTRKH